MLFRSAFKTEHPKEMYLLAFSEMCQRFGFYGIAYLLVLYLTQSRGFIDSSADHVYGIFTGIAFFLPLIGGYLADRIGYGRCVVAGLIFGAAGGVCLATETMPMMYFGLLLAALGTGFYTPSIYALLGKVYDDKHALREGGFTIYYCAVNLGIFLAMIILGVLTSEGLWSLSFMIAGLAQLIGIFPLWYVLKVSKLIPKSHCFTGERPAFKKVPLQKQERDRIHVILVLSFFAIIFWATFNQAGSSMNLFALYFTDRHIGSFEMPPTWLVSSESFFLILFAIPVTAFYLYLCRRKLDLSPPMKCVLGFLAMIVCFGIMVIGSSIIPPGVTNLRVPPIYLFLAYAFMALAEIFISPIGLSLITHLSPHRYTALLVGVWYVCIGLGFYLGGLIATLMGHLDALSTFFGFNLLLLCLAAFFLLLMAKWLDQKRHLQSS